MSGTPLLWRSVAELAEVWRQSQTVRRFASELPIYGRDKSPLGLVLEEAAASGVRLMSRPLCAVSELRSYHSSEVPDANLRQALRSWMNEAALVERALTGTLRWLRARIPGYPALHAPQLATNGPCMTSEYTRRLRWKPGERSLGFDSMESPPDVLNALALQAVREDLRQAIHAFMDELKSSDPFRSLSAALAALDPCAIDELRSSRTRLSDRVSGANIDRFEPRLVHRRLQYREDCLREELDGLRGAAARYATAFEEVDQFIELVLDVFGQLVCFDLHKHVTDAHDFSYEPYPDRTASFEIRSGPLLHVGALLRVDDGMGSQFVRAYACSTTATRSTGITQRFEGEVLCGAADVWC